MKVLMIEHFSAGNEYSLELCRRLSELVDITLLTVDNSLAREDNNYAVKKILCGYGHPVGQRIGKYARSIFAMFKEALFGGYDVIHVQTLRLIYAEVPMYAIFRLAGKKITYTVHNVMPHEGIAGQRMFYKAMYMLSDGLIVHNEASKSALERECKGVSQKTRVIPRGIYDVYKDAYGKQAEEKINDTNRNGDITNLLLIGKLRAYKGADILVKAVSVMPDEYKSRLRVIVAGKQEMECNLEELVSRFGVEDIVELRKGFLPNDEVARLMIECDACVFPYKEIYGSGALLLAYTFGKPVIASDLPTFLEDTNSGCTGLLFRNEDSEDFAGKIMQFMDMDNMDRMRFSENISRLVETRHNWKITSKSTFELYKSIQ